MIHAVHLHSGVFISLPIGPWVNPVLEVRQHSIISTGKMSQYYGISSWGHHHL